MQGELAKNVGRPLECWSAGEWSRVESKKSSKEGPDSNVRLCCGVE